MIRAALLASSLIALAAAPAFAAPETFKLDKPHTQIMFSVGHMGFSHSFGKFESYEGRMMFDRDRPETSSVEATIHVSSLNMGDPVWREHTLKMFKPDQFPDMKFKSTAVKVTGSNTADVTGDFTMMGVTKPVVLHVTFNKAEKNAFGKYVAGFDATADLKRSEFGMNDGIPMVTDEVHIILSAEANRDPMPGDVDTK